jgi:hypothetical protein
MTQQRGTTLHNGQPQTEAAAITLFTFDAVELAEDRTSKFRRYAQARIPDLKMNLVASTSAGHRNPTVVGIADGVGYEVEHDPLQERLVAAHEGITGNDQRPQALFFSDRTKCLLDPVQQLLHREHHHVGRDHAAFQARHHQDGASSPLLTSSPPLAEGHRLRGKGWDSY